MEFAEKRLFATLALILVFAFSFVHMPIGISEELNADVQKEALSIITDVIGLDLTRYGSKHSNYNSEIYDGVFREYVDYTLEASGSKVSVFLTFANNILIQWCIYPLEGAPLYTEPLAANPLDTVKDTLQRYQEYANAALVQEARNVLDTVAELKTINTTVGDLKMRVSEENSFTNIHWVRTINGLEFTTGLGVRLTNGIVDIFTDRSRFFKIGSSEVNISREEAVRIAQEEAKAFTTVKIWLGNGYETFPFRVKEEPFTVRLQVGTDNFMMYPYWYVWFVADPEVYSVKGVEVYMRADTGEVAYSQTTRSYGVVSDPDAASATTPDPQASPDTQLESDPNPPLAVYVIAGIAAIGIALAIAAVAVKKKRK
jgi:hypothetical protein